MMRFLSANRKEGEGSEPANSETVSKSPAGGDLVEPTATEITNQSFTFDDSVVMFLSSQVTTPSYT